MLRGKFLAWSVFFFIRKQERFCWNEHTWKLIALLHLFLVLRVKSFYGEGQLEASEIVLHPGEKHYR